MPHYIIVKDRLKGFRKAGNQNYRVVVRRIGEVNLFRDRLNMSKLPARRIGRSSETQTKELDQAVSEFVSTVFENNRRDSIRTASVPKIKTRDCLENVMIKNLNFRDEVVRKWRRRNMSTIIQSRVGSKDLSEEFSFRERRDSCGTMVEVRD